MNFILKIIVLFLRIITFLISPVINLKVIIQQTTRIAFVRSIDNFLNERNNNKNFNRTIYIIIRELPICNIFLSNLVEKKIKEIHKNSYFFNINKFFSYWMSSRRRISLGKKDLFTVDQKPWISHYFNKNDKKLWEVKKGIINDKKKSDNSKKNYTQYYTDFLFNYDYVKNPQINLNYNEIGVENKFLNKFNLEKKKWICIHNRDSSYLKNLALQSNFKNYNFQYHNYRDSDVNKLIKSTKLLLENNFYVFRMGRIQSNEMNFKHPNFIDYAFEDGQSDFNDIFLLSKCEAYLGSDSGPGDISLVSGRARFLMNYSLTMLHYFHHGGAELSKKNHYSLIFKHLYDETTKKKLSLKEIINKQLMGLSNSNGFKRAGIVPIENSEEEILDLTIEMTNFLENKKFNIEKDYEIQKKFWDIYYANTQYRRFEDIPVRICSKFLSKNMYILE